MAASSSATAAASSSGLTRQSSIYSWTIDEFHSAVATNNNNNNNNNNNSNNILGSMNMEELLRNICTAEESCAMGGPDPNSDPDPANRTAASANLARHPNLARQGSLTLPRSISNKTVDEVWKEIAATASVNGGVAKCDNKGERDGEGEGEDNKGASASGTMVQRELTLGEMTLEAFLAKAGVVREDCNLAQNQSPNPNSNPQQDWLNFQFKTAAGGPPALPIQHPRKQFQRQQQIQRQQQQQPPPPFVVGRSGAAVIPALQSSSTGSVLEASIDSGATSSFVPVTFANGVSLSPARAKKRALDAPEDKAVEQRQRRMIKNRESAARSRERKQAYTVELETQVTQLKEENAQLSRQQEVAKRKRFKQLMETLIPVDEMQKPPRVLRRTRTAHW